jgi:hypothetical protein
VRDGLSGDGAETRRERWRPVGEPGPVDESDARPITGSDAGTIAEFDVETPVDPLAAVVE